MLREPSIFDNHIEAAWPCCLVNNAPKARLFCLERLGCVEWWISWQLFKKKAYQIEMIANAEIIRKTLCVTDVLQEEKGKLEEEMAVLVEMTQNIVAENARVAQDQDEYQKRYDGLVQRYDTAKARYDEVVAAISAKEAQSKQLADFIKVLKAQDGTISDFDGSLWGSMVEFVTVGRNKEITFTFRDNTEIQA